MLLLMYMSNACVWAGKLLSLQVYALAFPCLCCIIRLYSGFGGAIDTRCTCDNWPLSVDWNCGCFAVCFCVDKVNCFFKLWASVCVYPLLISYSKKLVHLFKVFSEMWDGNAASVRHVFSVMLRDLPPHPLAPFNARQFYYPNVKLTAFSCARCMA